MQKVVFYWIVLGSILFTISHVKAQSFKVPLIPQHYYKIFFLST